MKRRPVNLMRIALAMIILYFLFMIIAGILGMNYSNF